MHTFQQYDFETLVYETPLSQLFILHSWAYINDPVHKFSGIKMSGGGYVGMESDRLLQELKDYNKKV